MRSRSSLRYLAATFAALACWCAAPACSAPAKKEPAPEPRDAPPADAPVATAKPWPSTFLDEAFLIASEVRIEGPTGLLDHVVVQQDPENHTHRVRSVPEGLLQETVVNQGSEDFVIRCQLDQLEIAADTRVVVLERLAGGAVTVEASGDAYWRNKKTGEERRGATLRIAGARPE